MHSIHEPFMREAIKLSIENVITKRGGPFACVIVKDGKVIATGTNLVTSTNDPTAHAEVVAIRNACKELGSFQLDGCDIYTSCEPCPMCLSAIYWSRADRIFYANTKVDAAKINFDDQFIYEEIATGPKCLFYLSFGINSNGLLCIATCCPTNCMYC